MDEQGITKQDVQPVVSVVYVNEEMQSAAVTLASKLRQKQIPIDIDLVGKSLSKQMDSASGSSYAIIVGPKEAAEGSILIRNMKDGKQSEIKIDDLLSDPKKILKT
jgi:histidyl-tRNA synthetase